MNDVEQRIKAVGFQYITLTDGSAINDLRTPHLAPSESELLLPFCIEDERDEGICESAICYRRAAHGAVTSLCKAVGSFLFPLTNRDIYTCPLC